MKIHEYQAKELFRKYRIPVPAGRVAHGVGEVAAIVASLARLPVAVKSQIHSSGRGKGGGIQLAPTLAEAQRLAAIYLGMPLVTAESGRHGKIVHKVLIEEAEEVVQELYLGLVHDRVRAEVTILACVSGGKDLAEVAARTPERLVKVGVNPLLGFQPHHGRAVFFALGLAEYYREPFGVLLRQAYRLFTDYDCTLLEINPLAVTPEGKLIALDARIEFDPHGLCRHPELLVYRDLEEEEPLAVEAGQHRLHFTPLAGTIGIMVNGAGMGMATLSLLEEAGGKAANLLDLGGGESPEAIVHGFRMVARDRGVRGILVNIFGGMLRCDRLARSLVAVARELALTVPVVIRLEGTNVVPARKVVAESGVDWQLVPTLAEAARRIVALTAADRQAHP